MTGTGRPSITFVAERLALNTLAASTTLVAVPAVTIDDVANGSDTTVSTPDRSAAIREDPCTVGVCMSLAVIGARGT